MKKFSFITSLFCGLLLVTSATQAENLICRGANRPLLEKAMEKLIKQKLKDANIEFKKVQVKLAVVGARSKSKIDLSSMSSGIVIASEPFSVTDTANYPDPTACQLNVKEYIQVITKDGKISKNVRSIQLAGHLLAGAKGFDDSKND
jgi:hypothetical protein